MGGRKWKGPMAIDKKLIDQLLTDYKKPEDIIEENGRLSARLINAGSYSKWQQRSDRILRR
jgi:hypothetical protein